MRILHIENYNYPLPESLNEMTTDQLIFLSKLVDKVIPIQEVKVKMLFCCLGAKVKRMKNAGYYRIRIEKFVFAMTVEQVAEVSGAFDYLFTDPDKEGRCFFDCRLTVNPFPKVKLGYRIIFGPADALTDICYNRYIYLESYHSVMENKPEAVYAFLGCLFTDPLAKKRTGRNEFDPNNLRLELMQKIKPEVVVLMCWYYLGSIRFIADKFPRIFSGDGEVSTGSAYDGQQKLIDFIAKGDPAKKRMNKEDNLYDILYSLDYMLEKEEEKTTTPNP